MTMKSHPSTLRPDGPSAAGTTFALRSRSRAGMTIVEVTVALAIFAMASAGFTAAYGVLNKQATRLRCDAVANAILRAKVAKALTDPWIPQSTPVDCVVTSGEVQTTADPSDPYDVGPSVILLSSSDSPQTGFITGTLYRNTRAFESAAKTVVIDYRLNYTFRGKTYNNYASVIRAQDKI